MEIIYNTLLALGINILLIIVFVSYNEIFTNIRKENGNSFKGKTLLFRNMFFMSTLVNFALIFYIMFKI